MDFLFDSLEATWAMVRMSAPWLVVGFAVGGLLEAVIPKTWIQGYLGGNRYRSVLRAALIGAPLPLCSCSVLPTASALRRAGASRGSTTAFLISTPETGVDSIGVTWALMDPIMTLARPIGAIFTAIGAGSLVNGLDKAGKLGPDEQEPEAPSAAACCHATPAADVPLDAAPAERGSWPVRAWRKAVGPILEDLAPWLILGFLASGAITVLVDEDALAHAALTGWSGMLLMLVAGIPVYVCASASTPVIAALMAKGLGPGPALVFLLAGPATNLATLSVIRGTLGSRILGVYLGSIAIGALTLGWLVEQVYPWLDLVPTTNIVEHIHEDGAMLNVVCGVLVLAALAWDVARRLRKRLGVPASHDPS
tara:strand:- start:6579 stop:7676 length:1098 start_codon:yes stop_codon:yes gene_type:complete